MVFPTVCTEREDVKEMTVRKVVCELGICIRHRPVEKKKRTTDIFWLSATVVLFITKQKKHFAPVMSLP